MNGVFDWALSFGGRVLAIPELHAIIVALVAGIALTYALTLPLPAVMPVKFAKRYVRGVVFLSVMAVALVLSPTPRTAAWAFSVAIFAPLAHEWLSAIIYHRWPWLKPVALKEEGEIDGDPAKGDGA